MNTLLIDLLFVSCYFYVNQSLKMLVIFLNVTNKLVNLQKLVINIFELIIGS